MKKAVFKRAAPYKEDALNLPVANVDEAIPFYEKKFSLEVVSREDSPYKRAILKRDFIRIGLAENGGDPGQEGCLFEVESVEAAFEELNGRTPTEKDVCVQSINGVRYKAFFVVAPDGLCYMIAEPSS